MDADLMDIIKFERVVIHVQAVIRSHLCRKRVAEDATRQLKLLDMKKRRAHQSQEETALKEFCTRLKTKTGLTPEAFFRSLDTQYSK